MAATITQLRPAAAPFERGDLVTLHRMPFIIVHVKGEYADLFPGDDLTTITAVGRVLAHSTKLTQREPDGFHYVTIEPAAEDGAHSPAFDDPAVPPRLCIAEHQPGRPTMHHGTEGSVPLGEMKARALAVAERLGAFYVEPTDALAIELLRGVSA